MLRVESKSRGCRLLAARQSIHSNGLEPERRYEARVSYRGRALSGVPKWASTCRTLLPQAGAESAARSDLLACYARNKAISVREFRKVANAFVGAWRLLSFEIRTSSGEVSYPFGKNAVGLLLYSQEGYMAVSLMRGDRAHFEASDISSASLEEKLGALESYNSYCGRYEVKDDRIVHHVELSLFPNWVGEPQERYFEFAGDRLTLSTPETTSEGVERIWIAIWRKESSC
jgi:hypothetical protein